MASSQLNWPRSLVLTIIVLGFGFIGPAVRWGASEQANSRAQTHAEIGNRLADAGDLKSAEVELRRAIELSPGNPALLAELGHILEMQGRLEEASLYFDKALTLDPSNTAIRGNLAVTQWRRGLLKEAKANLESVLKKKPGDRVTTLLLGMVAENLKDYQKARELLSSVPDLVRDRPESIAALARSYYQTGDSERARETLKILRTHASGPEGIFQGGQVAAQANDFEMAEEMFRAIWSTYPDTSKLGQRLALVQFRANRIEASQTTLRNLISAGYESSEADNLLARCLAKQGRLKEAVESMERAIALDPSKESNYLDLGTILLDHERYPEALLAAEKAVEMAPNSYDAYSLKGLIESKMLRRSDAIASYARAMELNPNAPEPVMGLALAQWDEGKTQEAEATFKKAIQHFPRNANFYQEYGIMLMDTRGAADPSAESRGISLLETAIALDGSLAEPHFRLGALALAKGRFRESLQHLEAAAKLNPRSGKIHYSLARAYLRLGRQQEAASEMAIYKKLTSAETPPP